MSSLYQADYDVWIERQLNILMSGSFEQLDVDNLVPEVLRLAKQEQKELKRHVHKLLRYFLKSKLYPERVSGYWMGELYHHRHWIEKLVNEMPSMAPLVDNYIAEAYAEIAERLTTQAKLPRSSFPEKLACTKEQLLTQDFMPWTNALTSATKPML